MTKFINRFNKQTEIQVYDYNKFNMISFTLISMNSSNSSKRQMMIKSVVKKLKLS